MNNISYKQIKLGPKFEKLPLKKLFVYSFIINIIVIILGLLSIYILPPEIPLFYGLPRTSEQLAPSFLIILPATVSFLLTLFNVFLSINVNELYLKKALSFTSIFISILSLIGTFKIIFLIGSI